MPDTGPLPRKGACSSPGEFFTDIAARLPRQGVLRRFAFRYALWNICHLDLTAPSPAGLINGPEHRFGGSRPGGRGAEIRLLADLRPLRALR